jgi:hypothetical protein
MAAATRGIVLANAPGRSVVSLITPQQAPKLDERTREAWQRYVEELRDLEGAAYQAAETEAWEHLQADLAALAAEAAEQAGADL